MFSNVCLRRRPSVLLLFLQSASACPRRRIIPSLAVCSLADNVEADWSMNRRTFRISGCSMSFLMITCTRSSGVRPLMRLSSMTEIMSTTTHDASFLSNITGSHYKLMEAISIDRNVWTSEIDIIDRSLK
jgi:hypothetical protein